jgi:DNA-binding response OmpR family regulator
MRILLVEDDRKLRRAIERGLREAGHAVEAVGDAEAGLAALAAARHDVAVLDVMLPGMDGFAAVARARQDGIATPILLLTARDAVSDRVHGLTLGADDYLIKPFAFAELEARLSALGRRGQKEPPLRCGGVLVDPVAHRATVDGRAVELSARQFVMLTFFIRHQGEVVSRAMILDEVFGYRFDPGTNLVDVHVANLREKIGAARISTVRGVGYRMDVDET